MNRHLGKKYITINQHLGDQNINKSTFMQHMTINRHLGNQNNNKSTFTSAIYLKYTNESTFRQYIYNYKSTFRRPIYQ